MIDPRNMGLRDWADSVILVVGDAWAFGRLEDETQWREWATGFVRSSDFAGRVVPDPYQFEDWREWAMRVYPMLEVANA
jgi:hypothetical protein